MLEVERLSVRYGSFTAVDDLSFSVSEGQWLMIVGPNGAGKSTILNAITQGVPYSGTIRFGGTDLKKMDATTRARMIGTLSQNHNVSYAFSVEEIVRLDRDYIENWSLGLDLRILLKTVVVVLTRQGAE